LRLSYCRKSRGIGESKHSFEVVELRLIGSLRGGWKIDKTGGGRGGRGMILLGRLWGMGSAVGMSSFAVNQHWILH
jgi:hypothetical protein